MASCAVHERGYIIRILHFGKLFLEKIFRLPNINKKYAVGKKKIRLQKQKNSKNETIPKGFLNN